MRGLMTSLKTSTGRPMVTCPYCDQRMDADRQRLWWRRIRRWVLYGWIVGLGILAAEIVIEVQMISRQWELFDRTVKLMDLKAQLMRGR